jgi:ABC-type Fe3+-hydroxamate transport system substrate-binding protein
MPRPVQTDRPRIVSLAPSVTSILFSIGARRDVVGVTKWCKDVAPIGRLPQVGDCWKLDVAEVMKLRPSIIIGSVPFSTKAVERILKEPVAFLALNPRTLADIEANIRSLGGLTNRAPAAENLIRVCAATSTPPHVTPRTCRPGLLPPEFCSAGVPFTLTAANVAAGLYISAADRQRFAL